MQDAMIWSYLGKSGDPKAVKLAIESEWPLFLFTHVAFFVGYRGVNGSDTLHEPGTQEALDTCKQRGMKTVLFRLLFHPVSELVGVLTDDAELATRINDLKTEANDLGFTHTGFETEAYGDTQLRGYMSGGSFSGPNWDVCYQACQRAEGMAGGRADFITPAGSAVHDHHPYTALSYWLGHERISQTTYYNRPHDIRKIKYAYEIPSMFMSTHTQNSPSSKPFYVASDMVDKQSLYAWPRHGLLVWTEGNDLEVARAIWESKRG